MTPNRCGHTSTRPEPSSTEARECTQCGAILVHGEVVSYV